MLLAACRHYNFVSRFSALYASCTRKLEALTKRHRELPKTQWYKKKLLMALLLGAGPGTRSSWGGVFLIKTLSTMTHG